MKACAISSLLAHCIIISSNTMALGPFNSRYASSEDGMPDTKLIPWQSLYPSCHSEYPEIAIQPLQPSFSGSSYIRAFYTQFTGGDGISSDTGNTIGRDQFVNGHALYCFDLTPDLSSSCGHHFSVTKSGNLRLELAFEVALSITGNVLVYSEFDNVIEIDKDRKVTRNYGH